jgi:predicted RNA-binding Zn ribbon-like protein
MMKEKIAVVISVFLFLGSIPSIQAAQMEESDIAGTISAAFDKELPSISIMPDSWWYGMKRFFEGVDLFFTFDEVDKAKKCIRYAEMRLAEAREMVVQGESEVIPDLVEEYQSCLNESSALLQRSQAAGRNAWEVHEYAAVRTLLHQEAWAELQEDVPLQVRAVVHRALNYSYEHADEVLEVLESDEPRVAAEIQLRAVERNIQRIRRNIQENNTGTLETLIRECEEKMNASQRVMERVMDSVGTNCSEVERLFVKVAQQHSELLQQARNSVSSSEVRSVISNALNASGNATRSIVKIAENLLVDSDVFVNESIEQGIQRLAKEFLNIDDN